jgi:hypothetical protein
LFPQKKPLPANIDKLSVKVKAQVFFIVKSPIKCFWEILPLLSYMATMMPALRCVTICNYWLVLPVFYAVCSAYAHQIRGFPEKTDVTTRNVISILDNANVQELITRI